MLNPRLAPAVVSLLVVLLTGCAHTALIRGVAGNDEQATLPPDALINVSSDPNGKPWDMNPEITHKLERILTTMGFTVTDSSDADFYLFFEFDRESLMNRVRFEPFSGIQSGLHTTRREGPYDLTLSLRLVRAETYHQNDMETFLWAGGAILPEVPTESPQFIDVLLVAGMRAFPRETERTLKTRIGLYDSPVRDVRDH